MNRKILLPILLISGLLSAASKPRSFHFAWFTDTHVGGNSGAKDLKLAVADVNSQDSLDFLIISGDITELDIDGNMDTAKAILDDLDIPFHIIPGNHDTKWSSSGTRKFAKLFGDNHFNFEYDGIRFIGFDQGPLMRMGDGYVSPECLRWLKETLEGMTDPDQPVFIVNHYPLDESVSNWFEVADLIKPYNIQAILHGHGHSNRLTNYENIPGVMSRSTLHGREKYGGYTITTVRTDSVFFQERRINGNTMPVWAALPIKTYDRKAERRASNCPDFSINQEYSNVKPIWARETGWAMAGSPAIGQDFVIVTDASGTVQAYNLENGEIVWRYQTNQAIYSSPTVSNGRVIVTSTDSSVYCLDEKTGTLYWNYKTDAPLVSVAVIEKKRVYLGASDGKFRCLNLSTGKLIWKNNGVPGYVEAQPLIYENLVIFGAWDEHLYALDKKSGRLQWTWADGMKGILYSPAAVWPVATMNKVFISAPDRYLSCINASDGVTIWRSREFKVRETIGISEDKTVVFARTMWDTVVAIDPAAPELRPVWISNVKYGYDIDPSMPMEKDGTLFFGTKNGYVYALDAATGKIKGVHRMSVALINTVVPLDSRRVVATAMDGKIVLLEFR
ncbi:MAG: PQQ-binding-like beta-propeller repeat protein [Candidatus Marinimicrobia bacterium]|nr:PQQ-binding-like beta-propeller repeat protein [Candidatus Neomarinimicrobiota bacterium]